MEVLIQLTYTSMYLHTHTVLYTLWVECKHTYLCTYVQTHTRTKKKKKKLRLVRGKKCVFLSLFFPFSPDVQSLSATCSVSSPSPSPSPWASDIHNCNKQGLLELIHTKKHRKTTLIFSLNSTSRKWKRTVGMQGDEDERDSYRQIVTE